MHHIYRNWIDTYIFFHLLFIGGGAAKSLQRQFLLISELLPPYFILCICVCMYLCIVYLDHFSGLQQQQVYTDENPYRRFFGWKRKRKVFNFHVRILRRLSYSVHPYGGQVATRAPKMSRIHSSKVYTERWGERESWIIVNLILLDLWSMLRSFYIALCVFI